MPFSRDEVSFDPVEKESLELFERILSDLDTSSFTLEDVKEVASDDHSFPEGEYLDFLVLTGRISYDPTIQSYFVCGE